MPSSHKSRGGKAKRPAADLGPSQRQLRAGELVRHSLAEILREEDIQDPALAGVSVTVTEVRMSPDLKTRHLFRRAARRRCRDRDEVGRGDPGAEPRLQVPARTPWQAEWT